MSNEASDLNHIKQFFSPHSTWEKITNLYAKFRPTIKRICGDDVARCDEFAKASQNFSHLQEPMRSQAERKAASDAAGLICNFLGGHIDEIYRRERVAKDALDKAKRAQEQEQRRKRLRKENVRTLRKLAQEAIGTPLVPDAMLSFLNSCRIAIGYPFPDDLPDFEAQVVRDGPRRLAGKHLPPNLPTLTNDEVEKCRQLLTRASKFLSELAYKKENEEVLNPGTTQLEKENNNVRTAASEFRDLLQEASRIVLTRDAFDAFCVKCRYLLKKYRPDDLDEFQTLSAWPMDAPMLINPGERYHPPPNNDAEIVKSIRERIVSLLNVISEDADMTEFEAVANAPLANTHSIAASSLDAKRKVFLVHGHNHGIRAEVARLVEKLDLEAVILDEQSGKGRALIQKFEECSSDIAFAIVTMTADDLGNAKVPATEGKLNLRARQNVIFELGYFVAKLGRGKVAALIEKGVEIPTDYVGVEWLPIDGNWQTLLAGELNAAGLKIDANKLLRK